ncbi:hypothetical protein PGT21_006229 [Puccinia graminis f. sp. tritici]|uniref:Pre-rRNA-processing protein Ipi1 N-terminal domain-containing protein n=1 Tax=Puccinia graminis f. sp. tritici TaxID=56615 RepID=A0A5B0MDI3_PUCGR|nr:hypothetical protein PGTUg99_029457 [Puccinia graminis f. sp. tritici]KAA1090591.1 hypothetical protein PGT21_006229 [Puccinia graminis f. sp. tritici]
MRMQMSDLAENVRGYPNPNGYPDAPGPSLALSHIFADIRVDAIYIIDILLEVAPNCVVAGWPRDTRLDLQLNGSDSQPRNLPQQPGL